MRKVILIACWKAGWGVAQSSAVLGHRVLAWRQQTDTAARGRSGPVYDGAAHLFQLPHRCCRARGDEMIL